VALEPDLFFDLSSFAHRDLFAGCRFVWEALSRIQSYLAQHTLGEIQVDIPPGAFLANPELISIGKGSVVEPGAYIQGPCLIGEGCTVRHGAYIRGQFIAGDGCVIGHTTEVKNTVFLNGAHAAHFAYVGDSILGNRVNLGAGTKCANLRLDGGQVVVHFEGKRYPTGLRKFGAIIGDDGQVGCNAVTNPGTLLGKGVFCCPCLNVSGVVMSGIIKASKGVTVAASR
jgi:UDP-N-acetylglucosamine diphosphorylase / glucose-1-phosphate thymidylyltransferase / UDP-N-acetylgalactosamine diphosphorylase / glucosamine-1-phosphate N-acetyltransferase / galactosamine-1-phosphate N-acetyltransferase